MINILIKIYNMLGGVKHQVIISVFGISSRCKHNPTCSRYFSKEIKKRGTIAGLLTGLKRLLTCW